MLHKKFHILEFCPYYLPHMGGLETHADEFNKYLSRYGYLINVFTPQLPKNSKVTELIFENVRLYRYPAFEPIPNFPIPKFWLPLFWRQLHYSLITDPDYVISRTRFFLTSLFALLYSKIYKKNWIHIEHGSDFINLSNPVTNLVAFIYDQTLGRLIFLSSNINVSISKSVKRFVNRFDKRKSPLIYRGIECEILDDVVPDKNISRQYSNKTKFIYTGRLYKWKGVENIILAFNLLSAKDRQKSVLLIVGDGEDYRRLQKYASFNIIFLGSKSWIQAKSIVKSSDVYVHASYSGGGMSSSLIEAMYLGLGIVATPNEGAAEVINHMKNAWLVNDPDPILLEKGMEYFIHHKDQRYIYGKINKTQIRDKFSWDKAISEYIDIFNNL